MNVSAAGVSRRTVVLFLGLVVLVALIVWPSIAGRIRYAQTRAELRAIRDAAMVAELSSVGKLFTTLARVIGPSVVNVTSVRRTQTLIDEIAALHGVLPADVRTRHDALWKRLGVPQGLASVEAEAILQRTRADKKRVGNTVRYILAEDIGRVDIYSDVSDEMALSAIHHVQQNY